MSSSINTKEIEHFSKDSAHWWDENGPFAILHRLNPLRMEYIMSQIGDVKGKKILDIGCGGGLVCEPLSRLGADVTGIDADANAIAAAKEHATTMGLDITYINDAVEHHNKTYDVVMALEILEHVNDPQTFLQNCAARLKPNGILITSTLNRTAKSFAVGIIGAEYLTNTVPRGTHNWKQFIKPSELNRMMTRANVTPTNLTGLILNPIDQSFELSSDKVDVNYFMTGIIYEHD